MNWSADEVPEVPPAVVTVTSTVPAEPDGSVTTICVAMSLTIVAALPPKLTAVALAKLVLVIVTVAPPPTVPAEPDGSVAAARTASRRGDWNSALQQYEKAIAFGFGETLQLRVERLWGFFAKNQPVALQAELDSLAGENLESLVSQFVLVKGAFLLCDSDKVNEGRSLVGTALQSRAALFSRADVAYAEGLRETSIPRSVAALRRATGEDPLHYPSQAALLFALIASGELDAAADQSRLFSGLFPDSPVPDLADAILALLNGDRRAMRNSLDSYSAKTGTDVPMVIQFCDVFADALDMAERLGRRHGGLTLSEQAELWNRVQTLLTGGGKSFSPVAFAIPTVNMCFEKYRAVLQAFVKYRGGGNSKYEKLKAEAENTPKPYS